MARKQQYYCFMAPALLLLTINNPIATARARQKFLDNTIVQIQNDIQGENITIHCYSLEDDLGYHELPYGSAFYWQFKVNIWGNTKFWCDFYTKHGSGNYGVYTENLHVQCGDFCEWMVRTRGPCLLQTNYTNQPWCQPWKVGARTKFIGDHDHMG